MTSYQLPANEYTQDQILAALKASQRWWSFGYRLFDNNGDFKRNLDVSQCNIANDDLADIKRAATLNIRDSEADDIDFGLDRLQPYVRLRMPDGGQKEWSMGLFMMSAPQRTRLSSVTKDLAVTAYDLGKTLRDDLVQDRYIVPQGVTYVDAVTGLLLSAGLPAGSIEWTSSALSADQEWDAGTAKAVIINDLLNAINYTSLSFDSAGNPYSGKYRSPASAPTTYNYDINQDGVVIPEDGFIETFDLSGVPNVFVGFVSSPDEDRFGNPITFRSVYTNSNPASPTSTFSVGRSIVSYQQLDDIADQAALDDAVYKMAETASQVYTTVEFKSGLIPLHTTADAVSIDVGDGNGPVKYRETQWSFDMKAGAQMNHSVRKVVQV